MIRPVLLTPSFIFVLGCASISTFQSGKILDKKDVQAGFGLGGGDIETKSRIADFDVDFPAISVEGWVRSGLTDRVDAGIKIALPGYLFGEARYGLLAEERQHPVSAAVGVGYGFTAVQAEKKSLNETQKDRTSLGDFVSTLYVSRELRPSLTLYAAPRYLWRQTRNSRQRSGRRDEKETFNDDMVGGGLGIMLLPGEYDEASVMLEYNHLIDTNESGHHQTFVGLGADFRFK